MAAERLPSSQPTKKIPSMGKNMLLPSNCWMVKVLCIPFTRILPSLCDNLSLRQPLLHHSEILQMWRNTHTNR